jgi:hypothetical protein
MTVAESLMHYLNDRYYLDSFREPTPQPEPPPTEPALPRDDADEYVDAEDREENRP